MLDAGHGGIDGGASKGDVIEKDITLAITERVARQLKRLGAEVVMTRTTDEDVLAEHAPNEQFSTLRERKNKISFCEKQLFKSNSPIYSLPFTLMQSRTVNGAVHKCFIIRKAMPIVSF